MHNPMAATTSRAKTSRYPALYDRYLLLGSAAIVAMGLLMVASSSISLSNHLYHNPFRFLYHQTCFLAAGLVCALIVVRIPISVWEEYSNVLLFVCLGLLVIVLIPGIGRQVNGSMRWLPFGGQVSELAKLGWIMYLSSYLTRHAKEVHTQLSGFIKPLSILAIICALLLKEPDFGSAFVMVATSLGIMFLAGVRLWQFGSLALLAAGSLALVAVSSPYRLTRLTTFLNPWANPFGSGYQLTQSLIAFGRGSWFGVGLGGSIQKLFYLPEAHSDFLFSVLTEELGLMGALLIIGLFSFIVARALIIGRKATLHKKFFASYTAYGLGLWLGLQTLINIGVCAGLLPTKGLTLPLMSYGGSSMIINCIVIALLLRIDYENRKRRVP